ncbi:hypothetical protein GGI07_003516 [Coemansia sp. Benny D115]|nr:hypothetical protein GGI07_003516 [Coemansia sp. Benny D115]
MIRDYLHIYDSVPVHFAASFIAGLVATTVCSPADVIKSRTMAATPGSLHSSATTAAAAAVQKPPSLWKTCSYIYRTEGLAAFFKGWLPSYIRLCPQLVITFVIYEKLRKSYFDHHPPPTR